MEEGIQRVVDFILVENYAILKFEDDSTTYLDSEHLKKTVNALSLIDSAEPSLAELLKKMDGPMSYFCGWGLVDKLEDSYAVSGLGRRLINDYTASIERAESYFL